MRLAQRAYRTRKQGMLTSERARTEQLSRALDQAFATFANLYQQLVDSPRAQNSSPLVHLNEAATQMTAIAYGVNRDLGLLLPADASYPSTQQQRLGQQVVPASEAITISLSAESHDPSPMSERIFRAYLGRVISILSGAGLERRSPALTLPLDLLGEILMFRSLQGLRYFALPWLIFTICHTLAPAYRRCTASSKAEAKLYVDCQRHWCSKSYAARRGRCY